MLLPETQIFLHWLKSSVSILWLEGEMLFFPFKLFSKLQSRVVSYLLIILCIELLVYPFWEYKRRTG